MFGYVYGFGPRHGMGARSHGWKQRAENRQETEFAGDPEGPGDVMFASGHERRGWGDVGWDPWRGGFGGDFGSGRGRPERFLEQGDLRWLVLDLIAAEPRHGYEIIKMIEDMFSGHYAPSPGVIYPTLTYLEETGLIVGETQANKKRYRITDEGRAALEANTAAVQSIYARIEEARRRFGGAFAPEMVRAMNNLRAAIQVRFHKGARSPEALAAVTAALDRAAREIEQS